MKTAIKPNFFSNLQSLKTQEIAKKVGVTEYEQSYYSMSQTRGWTLLSDRKDELVKELEQMQDAAVANGASYEELGKNTLVISLAKGIIKRLFDIVEDSKEACERSGTI